MNVPHLKQRCENEKHSARFCSFFTYSTTYEGGQFVFGVSDLVRIHQSSIILQFAGELSANTKYSPKPPWDIRVGFSWRHYTLRFHIHDHLGHTLQNVLLLLHCLLRWHSGVKDHYIKGGKHRSSQGDGVGSLIISEWHPGADSSDGSQTGQWSEQIVVT